MAEFDRLYFAAFHANGFKSGEPAEQNFLRYVTELQEGAADERHHDLPEIISSIFRPTFANLITSHCAPADYLAGCKDKMTIMFTLKAMTSGPYSIT